MRPNSFFAATALILYLDNSNILFFALKEVLFFISMSCIVFEWMQFIFNPCGFIVNLSFDHDLVHYTAEFMRRNDWQFILLWRAYPGWELIILQIDNIKRRLHVPEIKGFCWYRFRVDLPWTLTRRLLSWRTGFYFPFISISWTFEQISFG